MVTTDSPHLTTDILLHAEVKRKFPFLSLVWCLFNVRSGNRICCQMGTSFGNRDARDVRTPSGPTVLHFYAVFRKNWPNDRWTPPLRGWRTPSGKSWIRHWFPLTSLTWQSIMHKYPFMILPFDFRYYDTTNYNIWSAYGKDMTESRVAWATAFSEYVSTGRI